MENLRIVTRGEKEFDRILGSSLPDLGDVSVIVKEKATVEGNPAVMITFTVQLPSGEFQTVQTVTTMKLFLSSIQALMAKYGYLIK